MSDQFDLFPAGLVRTQFDQLNSLVEEASGKPLADLQSEVQQHLQQAKAAHEINRLVNLKLATAIGDTIHQVCQRWDSLPVNARNWLAGAILYFSSSKDDEPDFDSPIGFEDDTEVLNACLRLAKLDALCLNVEDYDDA